MKKMLILVSVLTLVMSFPLFAESRISPELDKAMSGVSEASNELLPIIVVMSDQYDTNKLYETVKNMHKAERRAYAIDVLKQHSDLTQREIREYLNASRLTKDTERVRFLWLSNVVTLNASKKVISELALRDDVSSIRYSPARDILIENWVGNSTGDADLYTERTERAVAWNVERLKAPDVWDLGFRGEGITVAVLDTGVNYNHFDIRNRMWESDQYPNYGYDFHNDDNDPMDDNGHGTHCAGTVAGDGTSGTQTGVAPLSRIMALKVMDRQGSGNEASVLEAMQFAADNGAHLLSMSLGWKHSWAPARAVWRDTLVNLLSIGVPAAIAAGNEGNAMHIDPIPSNVRTPGDCPPPWLHPDQTEIGGISATITVGATDSNDQIANFSSRGPVTWENVDPYNDYPYQPGIGLIRPDVTAPGVGVVSLTLNSNDGYRNMDGTSMATPGVAGVIALMLSKDEALIPEEISQILEETAFPMGSTKNTIRGSGRVNALEAMERVVPNRPPNPARVHYPADGLDGVSVNSTLRWFNGGGANGYYVSIGTDNPPSNVVDSHFTNDSFYEIEDALDRDTVYYWQVDSMNDNGFTDGNVWAFRTVLPVSEGFETGDFSKYNWETSHFGSNSNSWFVTDGEAFDGTYSARSGAISHNSYTSLAVTLEITEPGEISFYHKVSSEPYDYLRFYVNTTMKGQWSGVEDWGRAVFEVEPGTQTFRWTYIKDSMGSGGEDTVWIDDITFPRHPAPVNFYVPTEITLDIEIEKIHLYWDIAENEDTNPDEFELLGYNVYRSLGGSGVYSLVNENLIPTEEYTDSYTQQGAHHYYVTAIYWFVGDTIESEPSESVMTVIEPEIAPPVINPPGGDYSSVIEIEIDSIEGSSVYYTTDNTTPNSGSNLYTDPFTADESFILRAIAYKVGHLPSSVVVAGYNINVSAEDLNEIPVAVGLQVYPNPLNIGSDADVRSNPSLNIKFSTLNEGEQVAIKIYNLKGQLIDRIESQPMNRGEQTVQWNLTNRDNRSISSGIYFVRLTTESEELVRRVMIIN